MVRKGIVRQTARHESDIVTRVVNFVAMLGLKHTHCLDLLTLPGRTLPPSNRHVIERNHDAVLIDKILDHICKLLGSRFAAKILSNVRKQARLGLRRNHGLETLHSLASPCDLCWSYVSCHGTQAR